MVASRPPGGSFGSAQPVSPVGTSGGVSPPALATDALGDAVLTWTRFEKNYIAEVAGYDNAPPSLLALNIPGHGTVGQSVAFSVAPLDVWSALAPTSWSFGDGMAATGTSVSHTYTAPGAYNVTVTSADVLGNLASSSGAISVGVPSASVLPSHAPALTGASESNRVWRRGRKLVSYARAHRPPVGTTFSFNLDQSATVRFAFTRRVGGRLVKQRCVRQTKANRHHRACRLTVTEGVLTFAGHAGRNRVYFQGRVSSRKTLPVGQYTLLISATNSFKERSRTGLVSFTIVA
jgi:hypothetical protein